MFKFTIVAEGSSAKDIPYLLKELRRNNLICGTEKDVHGDTLYLTHNLNAVKKIMEDYDNLMLDVLKNL